jgi:hypothetical protein
VISSRHAETVASPRGGVQGRTPHLAPHRSAGREDPRREEIMTESPPSRTHDQDQGSGPSEREAGTKWV